MTDICILGSGGYIDSVVLPVLSKEFNVFIYSKRGSSSLTLSHKRNVNAVKDIKDLERFDYILIALPCVDYFSVAKYLKKDANIWFEKPLSALSQDENLLFHKLVSNLKGNHYVGFNKRELVSSFKEEDKVFGSIQMQIDWNENISKSLWKDFLIEGGVYWTDGIHAFDMALYLLEGSWTINDKIKNLEEWSGVVRSPKGEIKVVVGRNVDNQICLNEQDIEFGGNEVGKKCFESNFLKWVEGSSNLKISMDINDCLISNFA